MRFTDRTDQTFQTEIALQHQGTSHDILEKPEKTKYFCLISPRFIPGQCKLNEVCVHRDAGRRRCKTLQPKHLIDLPSFEHSISADEVCDA